MSESVQVKRCLPLPERVATVAERWRQQYQDQGKWGSVALGHAESIYRRLLDLPATATADDVKAAIGRSGWVEHICDNCGDYKTDAIQLGTEPDYESATVIVCFKCAQLFIDEMSKILNSVRTGEDA